MDIKQALSAAEILRDASPASLAMLAGCGVLRSAEKGAHLFYDHDYTETLYIVISGMAALYKMNSQGEKKVIFVLGKGKALNEEILNGLASSVSCEVLKSGLVLSFPREQMLLAMEEDRGLSRAMLNSMSLKIRRLYRQMKNTTNSIRGDKKIAAKLWKLAADYGAPCPEGTMIGIDLTITYLADMLGTKRETASRQLKVLTDQGLVLVKKNRFIIPDCEKLSEYFKSP
ncbi:Crp/Fnr family transcriptional regulator [Anaerovorax odorimutans]|uniref:Crp/Fnr family transcriptional regulator n=1 Tax=Anaerovorax odorimutans TaxID=109327 RepID=A0ABT1RQ06_9FIRM|nr:Crp/Fnr family transcriptional regulator [Anaerovorax odorimutans]MCQ4637277.1 Crp/Fnr family transcriptional regulator [Anaerovorax odorimutans]